MARVVFLEDDAAIQRFVALVLEGWPIELVGCRSVAEALLALAAQPTDLLITDLMMPGETGLSLIERLHAGGAPGAPGRIVVLSAGVTPAVRERLAALGVWQVLAKPVSVATLEQCVRQALSPADAAPAGPRAALPGNAAGARWTQAIAEHFGGDRALFVAYRAACLGQFPHDVAAGDRACAAHDAAALRLVAHNLKTVLRSLGEPQWGALAATIERECGAGAFGAAADQWRRLATALHTLARDAG